MKPINDKKETPSNTHSIDTLKHVEKKLVDMGVQRLERHPADGKTGIRSPPPKSGHGGKFTWEGPGAVAESLLEPAPPAIDKNDPNYDDNGGGVDDDVAELIVGEVEVAKVAEWREGVARVEVDPKLK